MAKAIHVYTGKARETHDRVRGEVTSAVINKWYLNRDNGIIWKINSRGFLHVLRPEPYKFCGKVYYRMQGFRLTDANTLVATNYSTPTFRENEKREYIAYIEDLVGEKIEQEV